MSDTSRGLGLSAEENKAGPDYFGYYACEIAELLSHQEDFLPFSPQISGYAGETAGMVQDKNVNKHGHSGKESNAGSLFGDCVGPGFSDFRKERLKVLLRQCVVALAQEVDEVVGPVVSMHQIQSLVRSKKNSSSNPAAASDDVEDERPYKKVKLSSSSSSISSPSHVRPGRCAADVEVSEDKCIDVTGQGEGESNGVEKECANCHKTETSELRSCLRRSGSLCNDCGIRCEQHTENLSNKDQKESILGSNMVAQKENGDAIDDLQILLQNDSSMVEETMKKYSNELFVTLDHMEQKLEGLLDRVMSNCRSMTRAEKQQLQKLIQKLPPRNLDRVAEIIQHCNPSKAFSCDEIFVDLEKEDNLTLWRLYFYVEAVESARKLCLAESE